MATTPLKYLHQYFTTTLNVGGGLDNSQTTGIVIQAVSGLDIAKPGVACLTYADPINTSTAEWITYTSIDGSNELQGVVRGAEGFGAKTHSNGAVVAFPVSKSHINNLNEMFDSTGLDIAQIATPASPSAGRNKLYFKSDDKLYGLTPAGVEASIAATDSWTASSETWTYASAFTITIGTGGASRYAVGDRLRLVQTTTKYFVVTVVADTLLTVSAGSTYALDNAAITSPYVSHAASPPGFPKTFDIGVTNFTTSGTAFTNQPTNTLLRFNMTGNVVSVAGLLLTHATSGGTAIFYVNTTAGHLPIIGNDAVGSAINASSRSTTGFTVIDSGTQNRIEIQKYDATAIAGNSAYVRYSVSYLV